MAQRFFNIFNLTEQQAIALLKTPLAQLEDLSDRYLAASHLASFPSLNSINALIETVENQDRHQFHRIARRKAIESLGRLKATKALSVIRACLADEDCYTVENAVWALGEIGTLQSPILAEISQLLEKPQQSYRVIIQVLAKLNYQPARKQIEKFTRSEQETIASAAIAALCRLTGNYSPITKVVELLQHDNVNVRRCSIQDLIDAKYYQAIPNIASCPVSLVFRLRAIRMLTESGLNSGEVSFRAIEPILDRTILDRPSDLELVHHYDEAPTLEFLIRELYQTDFGICYLAAQTIVELHRDRAGAVLMAHLTQEGDRDYGAHYHIVKLFGLLKYRPAIELLREVLDNQIPQFQKSRVAAAISLADLEAHQAINDIKKQLKSNIWSLQYACLLALEHLGDSAKGEIALKDLDFLVREKASSIS